MNEWPRIHTYRATTNITLLELPELVAFGICLIDFTQSDVHEVITVD